MSLNNISLPPQLVVDLYRCALIDEPATAMPVPQKAALVPFLGKAEKNILIVVNEPTAPYLSDGELAFLTKVLTACGLSLADVAIVNWHKLPNHNAAALMEQVNAVTVLLFGVSPQSFALDADVPFYTIQQAGKRPLIAAPALNEIEKTKEARQQLWLALKQLFSL